VASYDHHRRSVYLMTQRIQRHPFLALFDGADPNASTAVRRTTTVPSQALFFLNDPMVHREAEHLARTAQTGSQTRDTTESAQVAWVFRRILRRSPEPAEVAEAAAFLAQYRNALKSPASSEASTQALSAWIRVLLGSNEFLTVD
jgi:NAD(P)-dependent dehydrogenase (short-subunit alcohol dehydrogenase family)